MRYEAVVFDMDGTLLNTLEDIADSANHILRKYAFPEKSLSEVRNAVGNGARFLLQSLLAKGERTPDFETMLKDYQAYYLGHCEEKTRPYDGVRELLKGLADALVKTAIVSNKGDQAVKDLNRKYFAGMIPIAVGEREGIRRKPKPDLLLEALNRMGCPKERALYVGDSEVDFETAKNAGMDCMLVSWGFRNREQLKALGAQYLIDSPQEFWSAVA